MNNFKLEKIKDVLNREGRSVQWLADELGYKNPAIYKIFKTNTTTTKTLENICGILKISPAELLEGNQTNSLNKVTHQKPKSMEKFTPDNYVLRSDLNYERQIHTDLIKSLKKNVELLEGRAELKQTAS